MGSHISGAGGINACDEREESSSSESYSCYWCAADTYESPANALALAPLVLVAPIAPVYSYAGADVDADTAGRSDGAEGPEQQSTNQSAFSRPVK